MSGGGHFDPLLLIQPEKAEKLVFRRETQNIDSFIYLLHDFEKVKKIILAVFGDDVISQVAKLPGLFVTLTVYACNTSFRWKLENIEYKTFIKQKQTLFD